MPRGQYVRRNSIPQAVEPESTPAPVQPSPRALDERRERRLRNPGDLDRMAEMKLAIPPEVQERLTREGKTARWVLDKPNRLDRLHRQDWDVTPGVAPIPDANDGHNLVLHEKYQDWFDEDQRAKGASLDEKDKAIARGQIDGSGKSLEQDEFTRELTRSNRIGR
jgi:hypothetical protein